MKHQYYKIMKVLLIENLQEFLDCSSCTHFTADNLWRKRLKELPLWHKSYMLFKLAPWFKGIRNQQYLMIYVLDERV